MNNETMLILIAVCAVIVIISTVLIIKNTHKSELKKMLSKLYVRFNAVKSIPVIFKLNKAKIMAKNDEDQNNIIQSCFEKYEKTEKELNIIQDLLNNIEDEVIYSKYKEAKKALNECEEKIKLCEDDINEIDSFLEEFSKKENDQREYATNLKEKYRVVKNTINENSNLLSIAYDGIMNKLSECEELFSSSEENMYASEFEEAGESLKKIDEILEAIKVNANAIPKCVKDTKGVLPVMLDEAKREFALTKQRGVFVEHLDIDNKLETIETNLNEDVKKLLLGETEGVRSHCHEAKKTLNELIEFLSEENKSYKQAKLACDKAQEHIDDLIKTESYVRDAYQKDSEKFDLEDLTPALDKLKNRIEDYTERQRVLSNGLALANKAASEILLEADSLCEEIENDSKELYSYKATVDKSSDGESRANSQLMKLQLVVAEVETKIAEYRLPNISSTYVDDLNKSREYINQLKNIISEIPINIEILNVVLEEAIDFVYKFYNNVNNIVGMAIMVENAIVFGNKYRSTFYEVDRELSKAEFQYLNGEYTKALKTAIACMETLFPDNADKKIMENA